MNDPGPYRTAFSDMASSTANQDAFFESLVTFLFQHDFDGVDIDWEYPVAEDRGGRPEDYQNFVTMISRLRAHLNRSGKKFGLSITLVSFIILACWGWVYEIEYKGTLLTKGGSN
jgi:chitinase